MPRPPVLTGRVMLAKSECNSANDAIEDVGKLQAYTLKDGGSEIGTLFLAPPSSNTPRWLTQLAPYANPSLPILHNQSTGAILEVVVDKRRFYIPFGSGRFRMREDAVEPFFGMRTALNIIDPDSLRSVDTKTFDALADQARVQALRDTQLDSFGIDIHRDVLRAVTGRPAEQQYGLRVSGSGPSLAIRAHGSPRDLPKLLTLYLDAFASMAYKRNFGWIDYIRVVTDSTAESALNDLLVSRLRDGNLDRLFLAVPEIIDWSDIDGFSFTRRGEPRQDIHIRTYLERFDSLGDLDLPRLKRDRVFAVYEDGPDPVRDWSVFRCLNFECVKDGVRYLLTQGDWFELDEDFAGVVDIEAAEIAVYDKPLIDFDHDSEEAYNKSLAADLGAHAECLDRKLIAYGGGYSKIEFCDVYLHPGVLIHVKRYGGSSVMSHLFAQAVVAVRTYLSDQKFREKAEQLLKPEWRQPEVTRRPDPSKLHVICAVVTKADKSVAEILPFFSRVRLTAAKRELDALGVPFSVAKVLSLRTGAPEDGDGA